MKTIENEMKDKYCKVPVVNDEKVREDLSGDNFERELEKQYKSREVERNNLLDTMLDDINLIDQDLDVVLPVAPELEVDNESVIESSLAFNEPPMKRQRKAKKIGRRSESLVDRATNTKDSAAAIEPIPTQSKNSNDTGNGVKSNKRKNSSTRERRWVAKSATTNNDDEVVEAQGSRK